MTVHPERLARPSIEPYLACPCGSRVAAAACCLGADGNVRKRLSSLRSGLPKTEHSEDGCYLGHTRDCGGGISGEHYISRSVLEQLSEPAVTIDGVHWLAPGERKTIGINSLTAKVLCERHNSALWVLDTEAGLFLRIIKDIRVGLGRKSLSRKRAVSIVSGEALELWALKIACGLFYSKIASVNHRQIAHDHAIEEMLITEALYSRRWFKNCGLYLRAAIGQLVPNINTISLAPVTELNEKRYVGLRVSIVGLEFAVIFDPRGVNVAQLRAEGWHFRPTDLVFRNALRSHWLILTWPAGVASRVIDMRATWGGN